MCEPISATAAATAATSTTAAASISAFQIASLAFTAGSTILGAIGQKAQADSQAAQMRYNAAVDRNNQIYSQRLAADARERGEIAEKQHRIRIGQLKGRQKTVLAANGVETDSGTALDILSDTAEIGELEALTIRNNAEREAAGFTNQANNFGASSALKQSGAGEIESAGTFGAATTLIGGVGSVADKWYRYRKGF